MHGKYPSSRIDRVYDWCVLHSSPPLLSTLLYSPHSFSTLLYSTLFHSTVLYFPLGRQDCVLPRSVQRVSEHRTVSAVKRPTLTPQTRYYTILYCNYLFIYLPIQSFVYLFIYIFICMFIFLFTLYFNLKYKVIFILLIFVSLCTTFSSTEHSMTHLN